MDRPAPWEFFRYGAITGNVIFVLWILRNGINEGFAGGTVEIASYLALVGLLVLNTFLLYRPRSAARP